MTRCTTLSCLRKPEYPDQAKCPREHRIPWRDTRRESPWVTRLREGRGVAKVLG